MTTMLEIDFRSIQSTHCLYEQCFKVSCQYYLSFRRRCDNKFFNMPDMTAILEIGRVWFSFRLHHVQIKIVKVSCKYDLFRRSFNKKGFNIAAILKIQQIHSFRTNYIYWIRQCKYHVSTTNISGGNAIIWFSKWLPWRPYWKSNGSKIHLIPITCLLIKTGGLVSIRLVI